MSSEREMKMMGMLFEELLKDGFREHLEKQTMYNPEALKKTEGFESLVTDEEYEAIVRMVHAFDNFQRIHNKRSLEIVKSETSPYQDIQYVILSDFVKDLAHVLNMMQDIHTLNKEIIDHWAEEDNMTVEEVCKDLNRKIFAKNMEELFS